MSYRKPLKGLPSRSKKSILKPGTAIKRRKLDIVGMALDETNKRILNYGNRSGDKQ
jgi:hypothetical protein